MQNHNKKDQIIEIISIVMGNLIIAAGVTFLPPFSRNARAQIFMKHQHHYNAL